MSERVDRAGALESRAQDEHATDHDRRAVAEDGERFIRAQDTRDEQHSHRAQCHQIRRRPLAQESSEDRRHQREDDNEMKSVHAHGSVADFTPRAVFADNAADHNREIGRTASGAERAQLLGALANAEDAHRFRVGVRLSFDKVVFDVSAEFIAKHISAVFPKCLATRRSDEVHDNMLPTHPQRRREQSFAPLQKRILRIREERHEGRDKTNSLLFGKRSVVAQSLRNDLGKLIIGGNQMIPFGEMLVHRLRGGRSNSVRVLPNLRSDVEQRDHDGNRADDLSEIGEVVEIHAQDAPLNC